MRTYQVIGVMSGTSMDGLDIAHCSLTEREDGKWSYTINKATTVKYDDKWRLRLSKLRNQNALIVYKTDRYFGEYIGELINTFIQDNDLEVDLISSHGHTIFHQPADNVTYQVGAPSAIAAVTDIPVVANFRAMDVVRYGEGAPISGIGDQLLFGEFDVCLNLGGFANLSAIVDGKPVAYDISPCNILLNRIAREFDQEYDEDGKIAEQGKIDYDLLADLNSIEYYDLPYPKSLGREWINENFWFRVRNSEASKEDRMKTLIDHIAQQVARNIEHVCEDVSASRVYVTGGGAHNPVLIDHLRTHTDAEIIVPDSQVIDFKEALIFALLGILRVQNKRNVLKAYTGAETDSVAGDLAGDFSHLL